jgi:hypothetical protein
LGRPNDGLVFLDSLSRQNSNAKLLDAEAGLAERAGQDDRAIALLTRLIHQFEPQEGWVLRLAALYYLRGDLDHAWSILHDAEPKMSKQSAGYWQVFAEISSLTHHESDALNAYQILTETNNSRVSDLQNYAALLQNRDGVTAARISELLYNKFSQDNALITALYLYQREHLNNEALKLLNSLSLEQQQRFEKNPEFIEQRAQLYWQQKSYALAQADFKQGMQLAPHDVRFLQGLIAVLIEQDNKKALSAILYNLNSRAIADPQLWSLWASGWSLLEKPEQAIPFLQAYTRMNPSDKLAQLALADNYANQGNIETADRIRRNIFADGETKILKDASGDRLNQLRDALFTQRLALAAPDVALDMLRTRLQQSNSLKNNTLRDLTLSWLQAHDSSDRARLWGSTEYNNQPPYWIAQTFALEDEDRVALRDLLDHHAEQLPRYDRIEAAIQSDLPHLGEQMAFESLEQYPNDDEQAKRFQDLMSRRGHWVDLNNQQMQQGVLSRSGGGLSWSSFVSEYWRLQLNALHYTQSSHNLNLLGKPPSLSSYSAILSQISSRSTWTLGIAQHDALQSYQSATVGQKYQIERGISVHWQADYNADTPESVALLSGGMKDSLITDFNWAITGREYLRMQASAVNIKGQTGQLLGNGQTVTMDMGHHFFSTPNEQTFKITATSANYSVNNQPLDPILSRLVPKGQPVNARFFVPQSYNQVGAFWDFGNNEAETYERYWRGFGELGITLSNTIGLGYSGRIGLHGPVLGYDRLSLSLEQSKGGQDRGDISKQLLLTYRYFY